MPPKDPRLAALAPFVDAVCDAVRACALDPSRVREVRPDVRRLAMAARAAAYRPEELLLALETGWRTIPEVRRGEVRCASEDLLARLVALCVEEYFGEDEAPR